MQQPETFKPVIESTPVEEMKLNPGTGVVEYWATLRASDFADGRRGSAAPAPT